MPHQLSFLGNYPDIHPSVYIASNAVIIGDVAIGEGSSIWFGAVLRGDVCPILIGKNSNVQDGVIVHGDPGGKVLIGNNVTIGHRAVIHGCRVDDGSLIGMGAIVLDRVHVGSESIVGAGSLVSQGKSVGMRTLWLGVPAQYSKELDDAALLGMKANSLHYVELAATYRKARGENRDGI